MGVSMLTWKLRTASLFGLFPRRQKRKRRPHESLVLINVEMDGGGGHRTNGCRTWTPPPKSNQLDNCGRRLTKKESARHEDFQSSCRSETMCTYRSLLVSIRGFNGGFRRLILPIRTHSVI